MQEPELMTVTLRLKHVAIALIGTTALLGVYQIGLHRGVQQEWRSMELAAKFGAFSIRDNETGFTVYLKDPRTVEPVKPWVRPSYCDGFVPDDSGVADCHPPKETR
jgi:hypothetical protein